MGLTKEQQQNVAKCILTILTDDKLSVKQAGRLIQKEIPGSLADSDIEQLETKQFNPNQPRDANGQFAGSGSADGLFHMDTVAEKHNLKVVKYNIGGKEKHGIVAPKETEKRRAFVQDLRRHKNYSAMKFADRGTGRHSETILFPEFNKTQPIKGAPL